MHHDNFALCQAHIHKYVRIQMADGALYDGIIEKVDPEYVYVACPVTEEAREDRLYPGGWGGYYPGYGPGFGPGYAPGIGPGYYPGYGHPRFRRYALPLAGLLALSLLPYTFI